MLWWPRAPTSFLPPPLQPKKIALDGSAQGFREIDCQAVPGGPARVVEAMKCPLSKQQRRRFSGIYTAVAIPALFLTYLCLHLSPMLFGDKQMSGKGGSSTLHLASAHCDVLPLLVYNNVHTSRKDARESEVWWSEGQLSIELHGDGRMVKLGCANFVRCQSRRGAIIANFASFAFWKRTTTVSTFALA